MCEKFKLSEKLKIEIFHKILNKGFKIEFVRI